MDSFGLRIDRERKLNECQAQTTNQQQVAFHASAATCFQNNLNSTYIQPIARSTKTIEKTRNKNGQQTNGDSSERFLVDHKNKRLATKAPNIHRNQVFSKSNLSRNLEEDLDKRNADNRPFSIVCLDNNENCNTIENCPDTRINPDRVIVVVNKQPAFGGQGSLASYDNNSSTFTECSTNGSSKSNCDSSGFFSASESAAKNGSRKTLEPYKSNHRLSSSSSSSSQTSGVITPAGPFGSLKQQLGLRSKVIDDLDRLLAEASKSRLQSTNSPTELTAIENDQLSTRCSSRATYYNDIDTTLTRGHEIDYSTLCRDEFSSFISGSVENNNTNYIYSQTNQAHKKSESNLNYNRKNHPEDVDRHKFEPSVGPTLIGTHETSSPHQDNYSNTNSNSTSLSPECELPDSLDALDIVIRSPSSSCFSFEPANQRISPASTNEENQSSIDKELLLFQKPEISEQMDSIPLASHWKLCDSNNDHQLSNLLDSYIARLSALLRLSQGDKNVSMFEAFGGSTDDLSKLQISEEFQVDLEFTPTKQNSRNTKVMQEVEVLTNELGGKIICERTITTEDFLSILEASQTSASLNWDSVVDFNDTKMDKRSLSKNQVRYLEECLIERFRYDQLRGHNKLEDIVKRHLGDFLNNYMNGESNDSLQTRVGWHENWLFASKCLADSNEKEELLYSSPSKRPKLEQIDLIKYSTLFAENSRKSKFKAPIDHIVNGTNDMILQIDQHQASVLTNLVYDAESDRMDELFRIALESSNQLDVCRLLLRDLEDNLDSEKLDLNDDEKKKRRRLLSVEYDASSLSRASNNHSDEFIFSSFGYLFKFSNKRGKMQNCSRLVDKILDKYHQLVTTSSKADRLVLEEHLISLNKFESERVKFLIELSDVELSGELKVIQFCSKISGSLPTIVRWFKTAKDGEDIEISCSTKNVNKATKRIRLREASSLRGPINATGWPMEMCGFYDYEYQTNSGSWFRFKRAGSEIMFEIRQPNVEVDYNEIYKCVIENYCSREERSFELRERQVFKRKKSLIKLEANENRQLNKGKPILRTWSQRTLHKPKPSTSELHLDYRERIGNIEKDSQVAGSTLNKRLNEATICDKENHTIEAFEANLGRDFPYHPENLLKRLEENKHSSLCFRTLTRSKRAANYETSSIVELQNKQSDVLATSQAASLTKVEEQFKDSFVAVESFGQRERKREEWTKDKESMEVASRKQEHTSNRQRRIQADYEAGDANSAKLVYQQEAKVRFQA